MLRLITVYQTSHGLFSSKGEASRKCNRERLYDQEHYYGRKIYEDVIETKVLEDAENPGEYYIMKNVHVNA